MDQLSDVVVVGAVAVPAAAFVAWIAHNAACSVHRVGMLKVAFLVLACAASAAVLLRRAGDHGGVRRRGSTLSGCILYHTRFCFQVGLVAYAYGLLIACKVTQISVDELHAVRGLSCTFCL